tara:strand:+ start:2408 stop:3265 length:858 start_codon:yes stop_codon:yes gene_type:complete
MTKLTTIPFRSGFDLAPYEISPIGIVTFTNGNTSNITPNQLQCEAYGYTYDVSEGVCRAQSFTVGIDRNNVNNTAKGNGNTFELGTDNTSVIGENNTVRGLSRNNIIVGNQNEITNSVNNAFVYGTLGEATADNSIVLGGNAPTDNLGERQSIHLMFGLQTTQGVVKSSNLNNTSESFFTIPENTVMYFHANIIAVRVGGASESGSAGDFASFVERGVVINKRGVVSITRERDPIKSSGTVTGWAPTVSLTTAGQLKVNVKGADNMTIEWCSDMVLTQIKTGVAL